MATAPLLVRRATAVLAAACALLVALPAVASAAPPINDSATTPSDISTSNQLGIRVSVTDVQRGAQIFGVDMADATPSPDDPILKNDNDQSGCNSVPTQGTDTVFYRLTGISERTAITLDTAGSAYQTAIAVFEGSIAQASIIRCERGNLIGGNTTVDFVSEAGKTYYVEVASVMGSGLLNLFIRAHDIQPPVIAVSAPTVLAEPNGASDFQLVGNPQAWDTGSGVNTARAFEWSASFDPDPLTQSAPDPADIAVPITPAPPDNVVATVQWPAVNGTFRAGNGTAIVRVWDLAGNVATARLTLKVRDRTPPKVRRARVVAAEGRKRLTLRGTCTEPGMLRMEFRKQTKGRKFSRSIEIRIRQPGVVRSATWKRVRPDVYLAEWRCTDLGGNATRFQDIFLYGF